MSPRRTHSAGATPDASSAKPSGENGSPLKKKKKPMRLGDVASATRDLNNANSTLNAFIGGRQRSWMWDENSGHWQRPDGIPDQPMIRSQSGKPSKRMNAAIGGETTAQSSTQSTERVPLLATLAPGSYSYPPAFSWSDTLPPNTSDSARKSRTGRDNVLPSPAPSHSPPTLEHRQLGQLANGVSRPTLNPQEYTTAPTDSPSGAHETPKSASADPINASGIGLTGRRLSDNGLNASRTGGSVGLKRSIDATAEDNPRPPKRTMTAPEIPGTEASKDGRPTPVKRQTNAVPDRRASLPGLPVQADMAPDHATPTEFPPEVASLILSSSSSISAPSTSTMTDYPSTAQDQRHLMHTSPLPTSQLTNNQLPTPMQNFSPAHTPLPSPGPSPLRQSFSLPASPSLASTHQFLPLLNAFRQKIQVAGLSLTEIDSVRLNLLQDAVVGEDWFFLCLHQAYVALSVCPDLLGKETGLSMGLPGWAAIRYFLRDNTLLSMVAQQFFVAFPRPMESGYMRQPTQVGGNAKLLEVFLMEQYKMMLAMRKFCLENRRVLSEQEVAKLMRVRSTILVKVVTARIHSEIGQGNQRAPIQLSLSQRQQHQELLQLQQNLQHQVQHGLRINSTGQQGAQQGIAATASPGYFNLSHFETGNNGGGIGNVIQGQRRGSQPISPGTMLQQPPLVLPPHPGTPDLQQYQSALQYSTAVRRGSEGMFTQTQGPTAPFSSSSGAFQQGINMGTQQSMGSQAQYNPYGALQPRNMNSFSTAQPPLRPQRTSIPIPPSYATIPGATPGSTHTTIEQYFPPMPMNILQSHLTSPIMSPVGQHSKLRRLHLTVVNFPVRRLPLSNMCETASFDVSAEMERNLSRLTPAPRAGELPRRSVSPGCVIYRLRCIETKSGSEPPKTDSEWVIIETTWPKNLFVEINNRRIEIRRKMQWGKDLPTDITNYLQPGTNELKAVSIDSSSFSLEQTPNPPKYFLSVEILQCADEDKLKARLHSAPSIPAEEAKAKIVSRLFSSGDADDDDLIVSSSAVTIDIFCPLSFKSINLPVRGRTCRHIECFDFDTFMQSRPRKREGDPPHGDGYRCPHCSGDARPWQLEIDRFMVEVLQKVKSEFKEGQVRSIVMRSTGEWEAKKEKEDKKDDGDEQEKKEREVICIDDD